MTQDHNDTLNNLKNNTVPAPSEAARAKAFTAAMAAFDAAQTGTTKKSSTASQGNASGARPMSIFNRFKRNWNMDIRIPIGATALGLLLLPLAMQLNSSTSLTVLNPVSVSRTSTVDGGAELKEETSVADVVLEDRQTSNALVSADESYAPEPEVVTSPALARPSPSLTAKQMSAPMGAIAPASEGYYAPDDASGDQFRSFDESSVFVTADAPVSTFSIDVDTASYSYVRRALEEGRLPPADAVRVEEMINYFDYDYPASTSAEVPFLQTVAVYPTPWNAGTKLMQIGIKGYMPTTDRRPTNLVFLIDTSGSMSDEDKLPLLKRSFALLLDQMNERDTIAIVTYAGSAGTVLAPTPASERGKILDALERLDAGGSTAGAEGIEQAYRLAEASQTPDGNSRVLLATDGDFNVGISDPEELEKFISKKRENGVSLSVLGFGTGNYDDDLMQALAQNGNGNAFYIDSYKEARKVLVQQLSGTLTTIAKDVKIQVEFNPAVVSEYRLVGYETRALKREDFNNDKVDAGDIGAGHTVTAIYEITPVGSGAERVDPLRYGAPTPAANEGNDQEYGFLKLRYKLPNEDISHLVEQAVPVADTIDDLDKVSADFRFGAAVAAFGQKLRGSVYADAMSYADIRALADSARGEDAQGYRAEFLSLVDLAGSLDK